MLSTQYRFIYLHVSKTAGNTIQELILPFSDDRKEATLFRDGIERYDVVGPITPHKHATLQDYRDRMGVAAHDLFVFASVREPAARAISYYFSPHRWARKATDGTWFFAEPDWDAESFIAMLPTVKPVIDYFTVDGETRAFSDLVRMESLQADLHRVTRALGLPISGDLPHRNRTLGHRELVEKARSDPGIVRAAQDHFAADMAFLGY